LIISKKKAIKTMIMKRKIFYIVLISFLLSILVYTNLKPLGISSIVEKTIEVDESIKKHPTRSTKKLENNN
jgi:hypothetical protein